MCILPQHQLKHQHGCETSTAATTWKLIDFGIAVADQNSEAAATMQTSTKSWNNVVGTARYMSPEQVKAKDVDHQTDIWSLGEGLLCFV